MAYDRITQLLQSQAVPQSQPLSYTDSANSLLSALNGGDYSEIYRGRQQENYQNARQVQSDEVSREMGILDVFERQKAAGDASARALDEKIKLFTGDDPEGMAIFLQALNDDPDEIDPGNSYQVMTKLAGIAKRSGYKSPAMKQKEQMDSVNKAILGKLGGDKSPLSVRNNNPGNMRPTGQSEGFQAFSSPQEGIQAMESDLLAKINGKSPIMKERYGDGYTPTLQSIIETWAPPSENDTAGYVDFVAQKTGLTPTTILSPTDVQRLIPAMIEMEGGQEASQYYTAPTGTETAQNDGQMSDSLPETVQLQVLEALSRGDQESALKIMAEAEENNVPSSPQGKLESDYRKGMISKETYDAAQKKEAGKKPMPVTAVKLQNEALDAIGSSSGINADLDSVIGSIDKGALELGPIDNSISKGLNWAGMSNENSRNFATFNNTLETLRNASLRLNKGVQTEGDAQRIWNEIVTNLNDEDLVRQRLSEVKELNKRAVELRKLEVDNIRANYGNDPMDFSPYENQSSAILKSTSSNLKDKYGLE